MPRISDRVAIKQQSTRKLQLSCGLCSPAAEVINAPTGILMRGTGRDSFSQPLPPVGPARRTSLPQRSESGRWQLLKDGRSVAERMEGGRQCVAAVGEGTEAGHNQRSAPVAQKRLSDSTHAQRVRTALLLHPWPAHHTCSLRWQAHSGRSAAPTRGRPSAFHWLDSNEPTRSSNI